MSTTDTNSWRAKHALAKSEVPVDKLPALVRDAQRAIFQRVIELADSPVGLKEREEILEAANELMEINLTRIDKPRPKLLAVLGVTLRMQVV
jgi:hypothetical protein